MFKLYEFFSQKCINDVYNHTHKVLDLSVLFRHIQNNSTEFINFSCPYTFEKLADQIEANCSDVSFVKLFFLVFSKIKSKI